MALVLMAATSLAAVPPSPLAAQGIRFSRLGVDEGLSHNTVLSITQDANGFLWIGTQVGLNRYDGRTLRVQWSTGGEPSPVSFAGVRALHVDRSGNLLAGVDGHGLYRFDESREEFSSVPFFGSAGDRIAGPGQVWDFAQAGDSTVLAVTSQGLARVETDAEDGLALTLVPFHGGDECAGRPTAIAAAPDDFIWLGTEDGCVKILSLDDGTIMDRAPVARLEGEVESIEPGIGDLVWVGTDPGGLYAFDRSGRRLRHVPPPPPIDETNGNRIWDVLVSAGGETWVGTRAGLRQVGDGDGGAWYSMDATRLGGLPHDFVTSLYEDRHGVLWVGTWNGLARLSPFHRAIQVVPSPTSPDGGSIGGLVAIEGLEDGRFLVGALGGRLLTLSPSSGGSMEMMPAAPSNLSDVYGIATDEGGGTWVATAGTGVHHGADGDWRSYRRSTGGIPDDNVASVTVDRRGTVWAGTMGQGLTVYDPERDVFIPYRGPNGDFEYAAPYIWPIVEASDGSLWFGANGANGGIHRLGPDRAELDTYVTGDDPATPNSGRVLTIHLVGDGAVWFGTQGSGLGSLDVASGAVRFYTTADGLPHDNVYAILDDEGGHLWVTTERGLARFDPEDGSFWVFGEDSGAQGNQFHANSRYKAPDGRLYFGGANGLNVIDPSELTPRDLPPPVALVRFMVRGRDRPEINHQVAQNGLVLPFGENFFTIEFAALDFTDVTQNRYRYMLDPLDEQWVDNENERSANYTSVPPGDYTFMVSAANGAGTWNEAGLRIPITIEPPFYATLWFRILVVGTTTVIVAAALNYRTRQQLQVERMRLRIAGELHDDLGANLSTIALRAQMAEAAGQVGAQAQRQLRSVGTLARRTAETLREMVWVVNTDYDTVTHLVTRLEDTAATLLEGAVPYSFRLTGEIPDRSLGMELRQSLYLCFKEALQNVLKHADADHVEIRVAYERPFLRFEVSDDGRGFDTGTVERGNGLGLMQRRAERHRARLDIVSTPGEGTTLRFSARVG